MGTSKDFFHFLKHFTARALCLIVVPILLYVGIFYIHLTVLSKSGTGDGFYSSLFQSSLEGNRLYNASMPREVAYGASVSLKNHRTGGAYLHSHFHLYPEGMGAKQQQVTTYAHKDENNLFIIKKWNEEPPNNTDPDAIVDFVKNGDLVRLEHFTSRRNIHSHREPAPVSKRHFQVTGYGENGTGDANDVWRLEIVGGREGEVVNTVTTKLKFHHYFVKCVLTCSTKPLPKWGFEQGEVHRGAPGDAEGERGVEAEGGRDDVKTVGMADQPSRSVVLRRGRQDEDLSAWQSSHLVGQYCLPVHLPGSVRLGKL